MKYLLVQVVLNLMSVAILYYLFSQEYFTPQYSNGDINWYTLGTFLFFVFIFLQSAVGLIVYLVEKFMAFGKNEYPNFYYSLRWGLAVSLIIIIFLLLNVFHLLNLQWGILIVFILFVGFLLIK